MTEYNREALYVKYISDHKHELKPAKPLDIGMDLPSRVDGVKVTPDTTHEINGITKSIYIYDDHFFIPPGGKAEIPCGLHVKVPDDCWGNIKARSSTGWKKALDVFEGTIDAGYTGKLFVLAFNPTDKPVRVDDGDRLAQLILIPRLERQPGIIETDEMPKTARGESGFGSSGGHKKECKELI